MSSPNSGEPFDAGDQDASVSKQPSEIAPLDQPMAARISDHADTPMSPAVADTSGPMPQVAPAENVPDNLRSEYSRALMSGETDGPNDFAERVAGVGLSLADGNPDPSAAAQAVNGAKALAAALPSHEELIDRSAAIAHDVYGEASPGAVAVVKQNLLDAWAQTGMTPDSLVAQANLDPEFKQLLATPPPAPVSASPQFPVSADLFSSEDQVQNPEGFVKAAGNQLLSDDPTGLAGIMKSLGLGNIHEEQAAWDKEAGEREQALIAEGVSPNKAFLQAQVGADIPPYAMAFGVGNIEGVGSIAARNAAVSEAVTHGALITSLQKWFPTLKSDEAAAARGTMRTASGNVQWTEDSFTAMMDGYKPLIAENMPARDQFIEDASAYAKASTAAKEQWVAEGNPAESFDPDAAGLVRPTPDPITTLINHAEGNPVGPKLEQGDPLLPLAEDIRGINESMRSRIEQNLDIEGWIERYWAHNWENPAEVNRTMSSGMRGRFATGRTIPYDIDGIMAGFKPGFPDPIDNMFRDISGKSAFIEHETALQTLEKQGQMYWDRSSRQDGDVKLNIPARRPKNQPEDGEAPQPKSTPRQITDDTGRPIEMANKIEGPEAQGKIGSEPPTYTGEAQKQIGQDHPVGEPAQTPPWYQEPLLTGPAEGAEAEAAAAKTGNTRNTPPDQEWAFAHPAVATTYNNWAGAGFNQWQRGGAIARNLQMASNASTALKLGLSGAHVFNIAQESFFSGLTQAFGEFAHGEIALGLKDMGMSVTLFPRLIDTYMTGREFQRSWVGNGGNTDVQQAIFKNFRDASARPMGRGAEYMIGQSRNLFTAWKNEGAWGLANLEGTLGKVARGAAAFPAVVGQAVNAAADDLGRIIGAGKTEGIPYKIAATPYRMAAWGAYRLGDVATTLSGPLFDDVIPKLKYGAAYKEMEMWMRHNPTADDATQLAQARQILDSMDDRFGELNQNNIFVSRSVKQVANATLLSTGWWYGTMRAFGKGMEDLASGQLTTRSRWLLAWPLGTAVIGNAYQAYMTGKGPQSVGDAAMAAFAPRTGGTLPSGEPERAKFLNPVKEFTDLYSLGFAAMHAGNDGVIDGVKAGISALGAYTGEKFNPALKAGIDAFFASKAGQDWKAKMMQDVNPFITSYQKKEGSNITTGQNWWGFGQAPRSIADPEALGTILDKVTARNRYNEQYSKWRQNQELENPDDNVDKPVYPAELMSNGGTGTATPRGASGRNSSGYWWKNK